MKTTISSVAASSPGHYILVFGATVLAALWSLPATAAQLGCAPEGKTWWYEGDRRIESCLLRQDAIAGKAGTDDQVIVVNGQANPGAIICQDVLSFDYPRVCLAFRNLRDGPNTGAVLLLHNRDLYDNTAGQFTIDVGDDDLGDCPDGELCFKQFDVTPAPATAPDLPEDPAPPETQCDIPDTGWSTNSTPGHTYTQWRWVNCVRETRRVTNPAEPPASQCLLPDTAWSPVLDTPGLTYTQTRQVVCATQTRTTTNPRLPDCNTIWQPPLDGFCPTDTVTQSRELLAGLACTIQERRLRGTKSCRDPEPPCEYGPWTPPATGFWKWQPVNQTRTPSRAGCIDVTQTVMGEKKIVFTYRWVDATSLYCGTNTTTCGNRGNPAGPSIGDTCTPGGGGHVTSTVGRYGEILVCMPSGV